MKGISIAEVLIVVLLLFILSFATLFFYESIGERASGQPLKPDPTSTENVDQLMGKMENASIAFNSPREINIHESAQIQVLLSLKDPPNQLKTLIAGEGEKNIDNIKVSNIMEARLSGHMFEVTSIVPEIQAVSNREQTQWRWIIHPKKQGRHKLHLTLTALLEVNGQPTPRAIKTFDKTINVKVTTGQQIKFFFENNWQWVWAALLIPVASGLHKRRKTHQSNDSI